MTGTYNGTLTTGDGVGMFNNLENYLITGGAGRFSGAFGTLTGTGTVVFAPNAPPTSRQSITGSFSAVPEPASWMMMLVGFGAVGRAVRRRGTTASAAVLAA